MEFIVLVWSLLGYKVNKIARDCLESPSLYSVSEVDTFQ